MHALCAAGTLAPRRPVTCVYLRHPQAPKVAATLALALAAVVCVAVTSNQMGKVELEEMEQLHARTSFSVADAILKSAHVHDKKSSIPASIAALAAQAAREKETGQLTATVELPQIPKKIAAMAAEVSPLCRARGQPRPSLHFTASTRHPSLRPPRPFGAPCCR